MRLLIAALFGLVCTAGAAQAALPAGSTAPDFSIDATQGGSSFAFHLADALKQGPVVRLHLRLHRGGA